MFDLSAVKLEQLQNQGFIIEKWSSIVVTMDNLFYDCVYALYSL